MAQRMRESGSGPPSPLEDLQDGGGRPPPGTGRLCGVHLRHPGRGGMPPRPQLHRPHLGPSARGTLQGWPSPWRRTGGAQVRVALDSLEAAAPSVHGRRGCRSGGPLPDRSGHRAGTGRSRTRPGIRVGGADGGPRRPEVRRDNHSRRTPERIRQRPVKPRGGGISCGEGSWWESLRRFAKPVFR